MRALVYVFFNSNTGEKKVISDYDERNLILSRIRSGEETELSYEGIKLVEVKSIDEVVTNVD